MSTETRDVDGLEVFLRRLEAGLWGDKRGPAQAIRELQVECMEANERANVQQMAAEVANEQLKEADTTLRTLREQVERLRGERDEAESRACDGCNGDGWKYNAVEGRHPCGCIEESGPWQVMKARISALEAEITRRVTALRTAEARVAELESDRERLDWLEAQKYHEVGIDVVGTRWSRILVVAGKRHHGATLREAIDAARALDTEGGE